jgi:hypothetical protein
MRSGKGGSRLLARQRPPPTRVGGSHGAVRASGYAARGRRPSNTHVRPGHRPGARAPPRPAREARIEPSQGIGRCHPGTSRPSPTARRGLGEDHVL